MHSEQKAKTLRDNIKYLIKSRGKTQLALCAASGLTRSTIYNILEGRVTKVQQSTIRKISGFFGVSYREIETIDFAEKETIENTISLDGNMNPAAVPIIREHHLLQALDRRIGELSTSHPLTYYFGTTSNLIGVLIENAIGLLYEPGDLLIIKKGSAQGCSEILAYDKQNRLFTIIHSDIEELEHLQVIGSIVEERFNEQ